MRSPLPGRLRDRRVALVVLGGAFLAVTAVYVVVVLGGGLLIGHTDSPHVGLSILATAIVALGSGAAEVVARGVPPSAGCRAAGPRRTTC